MLSHATLAFEVKPVPQRSSRHEIKYCQSVAVFGTSPQERDQIRVAQPGKRSDLHNELFIPLMQAKHLLIHSRASETLQALADESHHRGHCCLESS